MSDIEKLVTIGIVTFLFTASITLTGMLYIELDSYTTNQPQATCAEKREAYNESRTDSIR